uniref:Uncharacterized protein n=1 Tax=Fagus sylvatica TaxID=28930 RepID=A0A2N9F5C2_FAGSY
MAEPSTQLMAEIRNQWKKMSPEEKAPFKEQARADFASYQQQRVLAIQEKDEHRELNSRCTPDRVQKLFKKFDEAKKEAVRSLGFASCQSVLLTLEQVGYILGLRTSGPLVPNEGELKEIEFLCEKHGFRGTETVTLGSLECALGAKDAVVDAGFKEKLVLFFLATVFIPTTSLNIPMSYLHVIKDIDRILFYDKVVAGLHVLLLSKRPPIWLSVWTQRRVKLLRRYLKRQGGYNKAKLLGTDDDHPAKNEKEANKEEKKKSDVIDDEQHNKAEGIILEELREDVKCMKFQLTALTGLVTETMHKEVASMITELLTTLKSNILQEIAKGTTPLVPNTPFAQQEDINTLSTHQGVHNTPSTNQGVHNTPSTHQSVHNTPSTHQGVHNTPFKQQRRP